MASLSSPRLVFCGPSAWDLAVDVDRLPRPGHKAAGEFRWAGPGGHAFNAAAVAAQLGQPTMLVSSRGRDAFGEQLAAAAVGLEDLQAVWTLTERTSTALVMHLGAGPERTIVSVRETPPDGAPPAECRDVLSSADWVDLRFHPGQEEWTISLASMVSGCLSAGFDDARRLADWGFRLGLVIDSEDGGRLPSDSWLRQHASACILTQGHRGGRYWTQDAGWAHYAAQTPETVLSTCGAGDAFRAGVLTGLTRGLDLRLALHLGSWCGAQAVSWPGAVPSGPLLWPGERVEGIRGH